MPENDILREKSDSLDSSLENAEVDGELDQLSFAISDGESSEGEEKALTEESDEDYEPVSDDTVYDSKKPRKIDARFEFIELLILTLTAVFILTTFFFRHSIVDGDSMMNTLHDGDALIISNLFYTPKQYDIVVIEDHSTGLDHPLVKRVIAVGGDIVQITSDEIYVNGEPVRDDFVYTGDYIGDYKYAPESFTVEEGQIFVLGDHRNDSLDSRRFGTVSVNSIIGKVLFRFYPFADFGSVYK